jgi:RNA polymerase primary sigma factor
MGEVRNSAYRPVAMGTERRPGFKAPLERERERALVLAATNGDRKAQDELVEAFMPLIAGVARPYVRTPGVERPEVIQEGVIGLLEAVRRYDPDLDTPFWAYAVWWVRRGMQHFAARAARPVVLSDTAMRKLAAVHAARRQLYRIGIGEPSSEELMAVTGLSREEIESLLVADRAPRGLEEPVHDDEATFTELIADPAAQDPFDRIVERSDSALLWRLTDELGERERTVVRSRYGLGLPVMTLREVGEILELSGERVRQIEEGALTKLHDALEAAATAHGDHPRARERGVARGQPCEPTRRGT